MLKSLYSGISGLKVNQQKLDVIGNNIANVSTTSFKGSSVNFQDMLSQSVSGAQGASLNQGGINGSQLGLGVKIGSIAINQTQGSMTPTGSITDLAIDGEGYFMVERGTIVNTTGVITVDPKSTTTTSHNIASTSGNEILYTRDGAFLRDDKGNFVTTDGLRVMGYAVSSVTAGTGSIPAASASITPGTTAGTSGARFVDAKNPVFTDSVNLMSLVIPDTVKNGALELKVTKVNISKNGLVVATLDDGSQSALGQIAMATFNNPNGLKAIGGNLNQETVNSGKATIKTGLGIAAVDDNSKGYGAVNSGFLEASNVDLAQQFTDMIVTTRAFEANGKTITNGDEILQTIIGLKR